MTRLSGESCAVLKLSFFFFLILEIYHDLSEYAMNCAVGLISNKFYLNRMLVWPFSIRDLNDITV